MSISFSSGCGEKSVNRNRNATVRDIDWERDDLSALVAASLAEGYRHVNWLVADARAGRNRFEGAGECLLVCCQANRVVGVCGLNDNGDGRGRLRRLYVLPQARGQGIGQMLVEACLKRGLACFDDIVCNAGTAAAARFYDHLGWDRTPEKGITHTLKSSA